jgi:hypothetical protein
LPGTTYLRPTTPPFILNLHHTSNMKNLTATEH